MRFSAGPAFGRSGFTLIETIVALAILMIVIGAIYGTFRAGNMSVSRTEERADVYQTARILLAQIGGELRCAYQPSGMEVSSLTGENSPGDANRTQADRISFMTTARDVTSEAEGRGDLCLVTYYVGNAESRDSYGLYMEEDFHLGLSVSERETPPVLLSELVIGLNCEYLDPSTDEWVEEWTDRSEMPRAVRVELILKPFRDGAQPVVVASTSNIPVYGAARPEQPAMPEMPAPPVEGGENAGQ